MSGRGQKRPKGVGQERRGGERSGRTGEITRLGDIEKVWKDQQEVNGGMDIQGGKEILEKGMHRMPNF